MITLSEELIVGRGTHRVCYRHPRDTNLCIKINFSENSREQKRELSYYRHLKNRNIQWDFLARYHGFVNTNIGIGYVFDIITDAGHHPSKSLEHYLNESAPTPKGTISSLLKLKHYLIHNLIITTELKPRNIVCINNAGVTEKAIIIDDIGNTELIPISNYSSYFAKRKIYRKWSRFETQLNLRGLSLPEE